MIFLVKMFIKFLSNTSQKLCFCWNTFINYFIGEGLNKGILKINQIAEIKDNKEQAYFVQIYGKKTIVYFEENVVQIMEKVESKKKAITKSEKENNFERQNNDEVIKK